MATVAHGAHTTFTLTGTGLKPGTLYGCAFEWQGKAGGIIGGTNNQEAGTNGKVTFQLDPTVLAAIAHHEGPGTLTLQVTDATGAPLGGGYTLVEPLV